MSEAVRKRDTTVNKIGGKNMAQLDLVDRLLDSLKKRKENVVLVVSAFEGVTNTLYDAMNELSGTDYEDEDIDRAFEKTDFIHNEVINKFFTGEHKEAALHAYASAFKILKTSLLTHKEVSKVLMAVADSYKIRDQVIGFGENMAAELLAIFLQQKGKESHFIQDVTCDESVIANGVVSNIHVEKAIQGGIKNALSRTAQGTHEGVIRILGGHVRGTPRGIAMDEGRGYSDVTAVDTTIVLNDIGEDVKATRFWKDVDGVYTANPKDLNPQTNTPVLHPDISIEEALESAAAGSGLINVRALSRALKHSLDLQIRNINEPDRDVGTNVTCGEVVTHHAFKNIDSNPHIDAITITIPEMADTDGFAAALTTIFSQHGISIDGIFTEGTSITFSVPMRKDESDREMDRIELRKVLAEFKEITVKGERYTVNESTRWDKGRWASISVIGKELQDRVGMLANISGVFSAFGINIFAVVHGGKQTRINYLIDQQDRERAVRLLHSIFVDNDEKVVEEFRRKRTAQTEALTRTYVK